MDLLTGCIQRVHRQGIHTGCIDRHVMHLPYLIGHPPDPYPCCVTLVLLPSLSYRLHNPRSFPPQPSSFFPPQFSKQFVTHIVLCDHSLVQSDRGAAAATRVGATLSANVCDTMCRQGTQGYNVVMRCVVCKKHEGEVCICISIREGEGYVWMGVLRVYLLRGGMCVEGVLREC